MGASLFISARSNPSKKTAQSISSEYPPSAPDRPHQPACLTTPACLQQESCGVILPGHPDSQRFLLAIFCPWTPTLLLGCKSPLPVFFIRAQFLSPNQPRIQSALSSLARVMKKLVSHTGPPQRKSMPFPISLLTRQYSPSEPTSDMLVCQLSLICLPPPQRKDRLLGYFVHRCGTGSGTGKSMSLYRSKGVNESFKKPSQHHQALSSLQIDRTFLLLMTHSSAQKTSMAPYGLRTSFEALSLTCRVGPCLGPLPKPHPFPSSLNLMSCHPGPDCPLSAQSFHAEVSGGHPAWSEGGLMLFCHHGWLPVGPGPVLSCHPGPESASRTWARLSSACYLSCEPTHGHSYSQLLPPSNMPGHDLKYQLMESFSS